MTRVAGIFLAPVAGLFVVELLPLQAWASPHVLAQIGVKAGPEAAALRVPAESSVARRG